MIQIPPITFTSERTSLENQIIGTYKQIREDVWIVSSAQTIEGLKVSSSTNTNIRQMQFQSKVLDAMNTQEYNREEILQYKKKGYIGENNKGFLSYLEHSSIEKNDKEKKRLLQIIAEENDARLILMLEVINKNENLSMDDLDDVQKTFAGMNREGLKKGESYQTEDGDWIKKK
ncbi:MAG: DUF1318 domain-containing protein [Spirochaetes bacterium]|nr:DUF1318 domain-containing protein [Spirochaetota bacterium]